MFLALLYAVFITQKPHYIFVTNASKSTIILAFCHTSCLVIANEMLYLHGC